MLLPELCSKTQVKLAGTTSLNNDELLTSDSDNLEQQFGPAERVLQTNHLPWQKFVRRDFDRQARPSMPTRRQRDQELSISPRVNTNPSVPAFEEED